LLLQQIRLEADGICSYEFVAAEGGALPSFNAGAHIDLHLPLAQIRSYSLANAPSEGERYLVAVQREAAGRGGSAYMHDNLRVGQVLESSAPSNDFPLDELTEHSVFIAGGIGITPLLSMISRLEVLGKSWRLHYASRGPTATAFMREINQLDRGRDWVSYSFSSEPAGRMNIANIVGSADSATHLYCCGPGRMIDDFVEAGRTRVPATMHYERFAAADAPATDGGYVVVLQRSGKRVIVEPGKTLLDALLDDNVSVPYACSNGICGTCMTKVIAGTPDHRDEFLSPEEKKAGACMLVCCSGSLSSELVLDL
jgi:vanillate O-demethylase ferredoxin subunit